MVFANALCYPPIHPPRNPGVRPEEIKHRTRMAMMIMIDADNYLAGKHFYYDQVMIEDDAGIPLC